MTDHSRKQGVDVKNASATTDQAFKVNAGPMKLKHIEPKTEQRVAKWATPRLFINATSNTVIIVDRYNVVVARKVYKRALVVARGKGYSSVTFGKSTIVCHNFPKTEIVYYRTLETVELLKWFMRLRK